MKKLGIDGRTPEELWLEQIKEESKDPIIHMQLSSGGIGPQVNLVIDTSKNLAPKQDALKPERSIQQMQIQGIAGQKQRGVKSLNNK